QEVRVQRMHVAAVDRAAGRSQRLAEHLPPEHSAAADVAALAAKQVVLEPLELQKTEEIGEYRMHRVALRTRGRSAARSVPRLHLPRFNLAIRLDVSQRLPPMFTTSA